MKKKNIVFNFVLSFLLFSIGFSIFCVIIFASFMKGMILGCLGGILFAVLISVFSFFWSKKMEEFKNTLHLEEKVFYDDAANRIVGKESVGGWLFLMEDKLFFKPHTFNNNSDEYKLAYSQIKRVSIGKRVRSIELCLDTGEIERFIVNNREKWIQMLQQNLYL